MSIYAIADLHLSKGVDKPMDIFGGRWKNYMERIAEKYLRALQERAAAAGIQLNLPVELAASLSARCRGRDGARQLRRLVQTEVEGALSSFLLGCSRRPTRVRGSIHEGTLSFQS